MISLSNIYKSASCLMIPARNKSKTHWAKLRRKTSAKHKALDHFDDFYGSIFGKDWDPIRTALLRNSKYVAVINNYGDAEETMEHLSNRGAHCLRRLMSVQQQFHDTYSTASTTKHEGDKKLDEFVAKVQSDDIASIYTKSDNVPDRLDTADMTLNRDTENIDYNNEKKVEKNKHLNLEQSLAEAELDQSRIINPAQGLASDSLYQYVPATKLKGMDEWVPESLYYSYMSKGKDFPLIVEPETDFTFPEHLKVYTYEMDSNMNTFPEPRRCKTGVFNYYPMDCGSVLTVLALCLSPGDRVLDLCSAPGGKSLVALQTLLPDIVVCNDVSISRSNRMQRVFQDYLCDYEKSNKWRERLLLTRLDGRMFTDDQGFDKVLVDVPCTTDRHSLQEDDNNIFRSDRIRERLKLPEFQSQLLVNALSLVKVGGAVVYSTCSLSPIQNDGVVHMSLKNAFETHGILATIRDLSACLSGASGAARVRGGAGGGAGGAAPRYGQLVVPSVGANYGPTYFARLLRTK